MQNTYIMLIFHYNFFNQTFVITNLIVQYVEIKVISSSLIGEATRLWGKFNL